MSVVVRLPDRDAVAISDSSLTVQEMIARVDERVARQSLVAKVNGKLVDLVSYPPEGATVEPVLPGTPEALEATRHSLALLLAAAVMELWPEAKRTIGPPIDNGFYYDFDFPQPIAEADLPRLEAKMRDILQTWATFERLEVTPEEAAQAFADNPYKRELIREFADSREKLTLYKSGNFVDLCRGGHIDDARQ